MAIPSVVVAAHGPTMLLSLKRLLEGKFEVAAMADNVLSMLDAIREIDPDLLVLDVDSAEFGGGLARRLRQRHPDLCILLVGDDERPAEPPEGQCAYVSKESACESLAPAAETLLQAHDTQRRQKHAP